MDSHNSFHLLSLCMRWIAHDMANPLSAVRLGLDMEDAGGDIVERGAGQLTAFVHCLRQIGAIDQDGAQDIAAPKDFFKPLNALAQGRDVEWSVHSSSLSLSLAHAGLAMALALPMISSAPAGGKIILQSLQNSHENPHKADLHLEAIGLSDKRAHHIKKILDQQAEKISEPSDMPLYIAVLACQKLKRQPISEIRDKKFSLKLTL